MNRFVLTLSLVFLSLYSLTCDHGLAPLPPNVEKPGFGGRIIYKGQWFPAVFELRAAAYTEYPVTNFFNIKAFSDSTLPIGVTESPYRLSAPPGIYQYIIVALQFKQPIFDRTSWRVVGIYYANNDTTKPGVVTLLPNTYVGNVNITVDFDHPPPQP
jgi:hypothetical protein